MDISLFAYVWSLVICLYMLCACPYNTHIKQDFMGTFNTMCTLYSVYPMVSIIGVNCCVHFQYASSSGTLVHFGMASFSDSICSACCRSLHSIGNRRALHRLDTVHACVESCMCKSNRYGDSLTRIFLLYKFLTSCLVWCHL